MIDTELIGKQSYFLFDLRFIFYKSMCFIITFLVILIVLILCIIKIVLILLFFSSYK